MNRIIIILLTIIVVIGAVITGFIIYSQNSSEKEETIVEEIAEEVNTSKNDENKVEINTTNTITTNSKEERISPKAFITFKEAYKECGHTTSEFVEVPEEFVNLSKEELQERYGEWKIEKFTDTDIILSKEVEGSCNEHFLVKDVDGIVTVFKVLDNGTEEEYQVTDIATEYLTDTDKIEMEKGIKVNGKQNLNQLIEDYE